MTKKTKAVTPIVQPLPPTPEREPSGLELDVTNLANLVEGVKKTFRFTEGASIKIVDLAVSLQLAAMQLQGRSFIPPGAVPRFPEEGDGTPQDDASSEPPQE